MSLTKKFIREVIEWDVENWQHALKYWNSLSIVHDKPLKCLELGSRRGGLSLWLANLGHYVICSDIENPQAVAKVHHAQYKLKGTIDYVAVDAVNNSYDNEFDLIVFKSIMGVVSRAGKDHLKQQFINSCYKALKKDGVLLFAENIKSSCFHQFARKRFMKHGKQWNYLDVNTIPSLFAEWKTYEYKTIGFLGTFGRTERQRTLLGKLDRIFHWLIPKKKRYIVYGMAVK